MAKRSAPIKEAVLAWLEEHPTATNSMIAKEVGCDTGYVWALRKEMAEAVACPEDHTPNAGTEEALQEVRTWTATYIATPANAVPGGVDATLDERGARYGTFVARAEITQRLKGITAKFLHNSGKELAFDQQQALDMIFDKIGRIINGDPDYADSWVDIAGYAKLVADRLEGKVR